MSLFPLDDDPLLWWTRILVKSPKHRALATIALEILFFPGSAAAVEQTFSVATEQTVDLLE
jgi:hypothetical protein